MLRRDGCDTIEGRCSGGVKDLRPRFTHTDIRAGQRHLDDLGASLRCRRWERSREGVHHRRSVPSGPGLAAWWSLVIDSTCQVCATRPHPILPTPPARRFPTVHMSPYPRHTRTVHVSPPPPGPPPHPNRPRLPTDSKAAATPPGRPHLHAEPSSSPSAFRPAANADGDIPRGQVRLAPGGGIRRRRGQQSRPHTRNTSPAGRKSPRTRRMSPHASELSETRRTLVVSNTARLPLSRGHRCPRMATDSTTTADTTFVRAALRTIVTIGDS